MGSVKIDAIFDGKSISVESDNLLDDYRKKIKHLVVLNPFQVFVEIPYEEPLDKKMEEKVLITRKAR